MLLQLALLAQIAAFPGAMGAGAAAVGGRGGTVIEVTNLNDSGAGSLRACIQATGPRYCIFRVFGLITQKSALIISHPNITIAGQSAPGEIVQGGAGQNGQALAIETPEVIIRYLTYDGAASAADSATCNHDTGTVGYEILDNNNFNIVIDHTSHRWWGNKDMEVVSNGPNQNAHDLTISNNLFYEPCFDHPVVTEPDVFAGGSQFASVNQDWHHNLAINYDHRWPLGAIRSMRWVNNNGFNGIQNSDSFNFSFWGAVQADIIGSNFEDGPNSSQAVFNVAIQPDPTSSVDPADCNPTCDNGPAQGRAPTLYMLNNSGHAGKTVNCCAIAITNVVNDAANMSLVAKVTNAEGAFNPTIPPSSWWRATPLPAETFPIIADQVTDFDAKTLPTVGNSQHLDCLGNWVPNRDAQDQRVIQQYLAKGKGGPWEGPTYTGPAFGQGGNPPGGTLCVESMHDGIPDQYKQAHGLSLTDPNVYKAISPSGYPWLDTYLAGNAVTTPPTVTCAPTTVAPGASSVCGANQAITTWSASAGSISPNGLLTAPMTPMTVNVSGTNANGTGPFAVTVATPATWTGWLGNDALPGAAIGAQVMVGPTAGPLRQSACKNAGEAAGAPVAGAPSMIGMNVTILAGPSPVCSTGGVAFWQVTTNPTPPSTITSVTSTCTPTSTSTGGTSTCTAQVQGTGSFNPAVTWSTSAGSISSTGIFTAPSTPVTATIKATSVQDPTKTGPSTVQVTSTPPPTTYPTVTLTIGVPGQPQTTLTCTANQSTGVYTCH
jgi:hypothetical protein